VGLVLSRYSKGDGFFQHLTAEENLRIGAYLRHDGSSIKKDIEMVYHYFPKLKLLFQ